MAVPSRKGDRVVFASDWGDASASAFIHTYVAWWPTTTINRAPAANAQAVATSEDTAKSIALSASDADGDALTYAIVANPTHGTLSGSSSARTYTPAANWSGSDSFMFKVNDGKADSNIATVTIVVSAVNDIPVANAQTVTTAEDTAKSVTLSATDADSDALTYVIVANPAHGTLSGSGATRIYTPAANWNGSDAFTFKANDGKVDSNIATVTVTVTAVNDAPVAKALVMSTTQGVAQGITLSATDADGDSLTYAIVTQPVHGSLSGSGASRTYSPAAGYVGMDSFTYKANDGKVNSNTATVTITVAPAWIGTDLGVPGLAGSATWNGSTATVKGAGTDMWGPTDAGFFDYQILDGDGSITARVASFTGGAVSSAKACLMIRESSAPGARCARSIVTAGAGTRFHGRTVTNGPVSLVVGSATLAPVWLRLERVKDTLTGYESTDEGVTWVKLGSTTIAGLPAQVQIGLAVCSRSKAQLATAVFEQVSIVHAPAGNG